MKHLHFSHFNIAGFTFYDGSEAFGKLKIGTLLNLVFEPENRYDPRAVAIYCENDKLGYIPRNQNLEISTLLEMGHNIFEARIQQLDATAPAEQQVWVVVYVRNNKEVVH